MKKKIIITLLIIFAFICVSTTSIVFAKYIKEKQTQTGISSKNFYFTVDLLGDTVSEDSLSKSYILAGGDSKEIVFNVQNFFDDYRICDVDVKYKVMMEVISTKDAYDKTKVTLSNAINTEYVLNKSSKDMDKWVLNIPEGYGNDTVISLIILSSDPYIKEMKLEFVCKTYDYEYSYEVIDEPNNPMATLIIRTNVDIEINHLVIDFSTINATTNELKIDILNDYLVDLIDGIPVIQTNALSDGETFYKKVVNTIKINAGEAIKITFFKTDISKDYSMSNRSLNNISGKFNVVIE